MPATDLLPPRLDQYDAVERWIRETTPPGAVVLDVGAGDGDQPYPRRLAGVAAAITGVDPDEGIHRNELVDVRVQATLEEFAPTHAEAFDLALALYVAEHVEHPDAFLAALHTCLRPGASAFLLTPSRNHYFGMTALAAHRLHIDEWLLRRLRDETVIHDHHFPIRYRMNSARALRRGAARAGFSSVEIRMLDEPGIYQPYFPPALRWIPTAWSRGVHTLHLAGAAGTILARLTR